MTDYRRTDEGVEVPDREERRLDRLELRMEGDVPTLDGYATVYEHPYDIGGGPDEGGFTEVISRGAGTRTARNGDIRLLINHDGVPLARSKGGQGTLQLESDDIGLRVHAELDPKNPRVQELRSAMERGDVDQMSFAFKATRQEWSKDYTTRTISEFKGFDVSVVVFPANPATVVKMRTGSPESEVRTGRSIAMARRQLDVIRRDSIVVTSDGDVIVTETDDAEECCPDCGSAAPADANYCPDCGAAMTAQTPMVDA
jgi:HK97 family phage prohead protease